MTNLSVNLVKEDSNRLSIAHYYTEKPIVKLDLPDKSARYIIDYNKAFLGDWFGLPVIRSIVLGDPKLWKDYPEISIEFDEKSNLSIIYDCLYLLNADYSEYNLGKDDIPGNKVIEIKSGALEIMSLLTNLYFNITPASLMFEEVITPIVEWKITQQDSKWKQKIALWFSSWSDPSDSIYITNTKVNESQTCHLLQLGYISDLYEDSITLLPDVYTEKKIQLAKQEEQREYYKKYYRSTSQEEREAFYEISITQTIEFQKQLSIQNYTITDIPQKAREKKAYEILSNKGKCFEYIARVNISHAEETQRMASNILISINPKDKNYDNIAKNAKDISTLVGVANDLVIGGLLDTISIAFPGVGTAASAIIKGAIFYGVSITKTLSCSYSLKSRNFAGNGEKLQIIDTSALIEEVVFKLFLCKIQLFALLDSKGKSLLESSLTKILVKYLAQENIKLTSSSDLLESFSNHTYYKQNLALEKEYEEILFKNETWSLTLQEFLSYDESSCIGQIISSGEESSNYAI